MQNTTHVPSFFVEEGEIKSARRIMTMKEIIAQRKYTLERVEKKLNLPFKLKDMIDSIPVANLQIGDTIQFLNQDPVQYERTKQIYCFAMVNSHKCLVSWFDFTWYRGWNLNEIPTCDALERLLPENGYVDFDFMYNHTFRVSAYCDVDRYQFNHDGTLKYVYKVIDGKETLVEARTIFQKPMYEIL